MFDNNTHIHTHDSLLKTEEDETDRQALTLSFPRSHSPTTRERQGGVSKGYVCNMYVGGKENSNGRQRQQETMASDYAAA